MQEPEKKNVSRNLIIFVLILILTEIVLVALTYINIKRNLLSTSELYSQYFAIITGFALIITTLILIIVNKRIKIKKINNRYTT